MLKLIGSCFIAMTGGIWGMYRSSGYRNRMELCGNIAELLRKTENMIRYSGCDVSEIVGELGSHREFTISGLVPDEIDFSTIGCCNVEKLTGEEQRIMQTFWNELGTTDSEGQLKMLAGLHENAVQLMEQRKAEYEKYGRLYRSVGLLLGLMAGIAVI